MFRGNTQAFNAVAQDGYDPAASDAARRRAQDQEAIATQQAHQRQLSGAAETAGELSTAPGAARRIADEIHRGEERESRERIDRVMMLSAIDQTREFAAQRGRDAANLEDIFESRFGDAWREEIANRVMDPDDIPQRRDGESMEDYRERLGDALIERMIDPETGEIRPEYRDDPEMRQYAEWAKARYDEREGLLSADRMSAPSVTNLEIQNEVDDLERRTGFNGLRQADQEMTARGQSVDILADRTNEIREEQATQAVARSELDTFGVSN